MGIPKRTSEDQHKKNKQLKIVKKLGQKKVKRRRFKALDVRTETETAEKSGRIWAIQNIEKGSLITTTTTTSRKQSPPRTWPVHQESEQPTEVQRPGENPPQPLESLGTLNLGGLRFAAFAFETVWWWWTITYCLTAGRSRPPRLLHLVLFACKERDRNCDNRPPNNAHSIAFVVASVECFQPYWTSSYTTLS